MSDGEPFEGAQALVDDLGELVGHDVRRTFVALGWAAGCLAAQTSPGAAAKMLRDMAGGFDPERLQ